MNEVAEVVVIGILLVFFILVLITLILMIFPYLLGINQKKKKITNDVDASETVAEICESDVKDDYELISILTAAIAAYRSTNGENEVDFKVVAFKKSPKCNKIK